MSFSKSASKRLFPIIKNKFDRVVNIDSATNGSSWADSSQKKYYYERARLTSKHHDFAAAQGPITEPVGGVFNPKEVGLWNNEIVYRLGFRHKGQSENDLIKSVTSEWFGTAELFRNTAYKTLAMNSSDYALFDRTDAAGVFVDLLRCYQGLGFRYDPATSVIVKYRIKGPTIALAGPGKRATPDYADTGMATVGVYQPSPQILVPGVFNLAGAKDFSVIDNVVEVLDIKEPVGFLKLE